jgi:hypothetical protein
VISAGWLNRPRRTGSRSSNEMKFGQAKLGARSNLLLLVSLAETVLLHCTFAYTVFLHHLYKLSRTSMGGSLISLSLSSPLWAIKPPTSSHTRNEIGHRNGKREMGVFPPTPDFGFLMMTHFRDEICFLVIGKLMLNFDSLAGGNTFFGTLFKLPIIHIHNYKFFTNIFLAKEIPLRRTHFTN